MENCQAEKEYLFILHHVHHVHIHVHVYVLLLSQILRNGTYTIDMYYMNALPTHTQHTCTAINLVTFTEKVPVNVATHQCNYMCNSQVCPYNIVCELRKVNRSHVQSMYAARRV